MAQASIQPARFDPAAFYGSQPGSPVFQPGSGGPFTSGNLDPKYGGAGAYGLPDAYSGWQPAARNATIWSGQYAQDIDPAIQSARGRLGQDNYGKLYAQAADTYEGQASGARKLGQQQLARAGYRGAGGGNSPFIAFQLQQEAAARSGALGNASRMAVFQSQQMQMENERSFQNLLATRLQAMLGPAQLQAAASNKVPTQPGPSLIGPIVGAVGNVIGAAA